MESSHEMMRCLVVGFGISALLLAGCTSGDFGTVVGTFQGEAGPASASGPPAAGPWPLSGVVRFKDVSSLTVVDVPVGASGKFSVRLAPGTYSVVGVTSQMGLVDPHSTISQPPCEMQNLDSIRVQAGQANRVTLICYGP